MAHVHRECQSCRTYWAVGAREGVASGGCGERRRELRRASRSFVWWSTVDLDPGIGLRRGHKELRILGWHLVLEVKTVTESGRLLAVETQEGGFSRSTTQM